MNPWTVIIESPAQQDIAEIHAWLAKHNSEAADRWFHGLYETIGSLQTFPERCLSLQSENISEWIFARLFMAAEIINTASSLS